MWPQRASIGATVGIDLGSSATRVVTSADPSVRTLPTVVALQDGASGREVVAVGEQARQMLGRTEGSIRVVQPVRGGAVEDWTALELLLDHVLNQVARGGKRPDVLLTVPTDASETERRALQTAAQAAGARRVHLIHGLMAGAIGATLPVTKPTGSMIVSVGAGRTEVGVISLSGLVVQRALKVGGDAMDARMVQWLRRHHDLMVGAGMAERIKIDVGAATLPERPQQVRIRGRDLSTGAPRVVDVRSADVAVAIEQATAQIEGAVTDALRETPPELCADILASGVILIGGSARLRDLDRRLRDATSLPFLVADPPEEAVARGLATLLKDSALLAHLLDLP